MSAGGIGHESLKTVLQLRTRGCVCYGCRFIDEMERCDVFPIYEERAEKERERKEQLSIEDVVVDVIY